MADMDQGIKRLIQTHPRDVLAFAVPEAEYLGTVPVDVATEPQLVLDTLMRVRYDGEECAVDIEAEARPKPDIGRRLFEYGARANIVTGLPVISVVFWLEPGGAPPTSPYVLRAGRRRCGEWDFTGIELYKEPAESLLERRVTGLLPLVPFMRGGASLDVIERTAVLVRDQASPAEIGELEALLAVFGSRAVGAEVMRNLVRRILMSTEIIGTSPLYQEWIAEATEKGREQGIEQGTALGQRTAALLVLRGRFGEVPEPIAQTLEKASAELLQTMLLHVATESLEQIAARLGVSLT